MEQILPTVPTNVENIFFEYQFAKVVPVAEMKLTLNVPRLEPQINAPEQFAAFIRARSWTTQK